MTERKARILRIKHIDFIGCDTELTEQIIRIQMHRAGFDFSKPINRWTDVEMMEEVIEQGDEYIEPKRRMPEFIRTIFQTKRTR